jgi:hypothetical protein
MRTVKWNPFLLGVCTFLGGMLLWAGAARADISSTNAAAIVVFPKLLVDTSARLIDTTPSTSKATDFVNGRAAVDTLIELTNVANHPVNVRCFYVNANGHCSNNPSLICNPNGSLEEAAFSCQTQFPVCIAGWQETDFTFSLTSNQPLVWTLSDGLPVLPLNDKPGPKGEFNTGSIPPAPEIPMIGELKCIEVGDSEQPIDSNDLKGEATIEEVAVEREAAPSTNQPLPYVQVDSRGYNAIGIQAIPGANNGDNVLVIGPTPPHESAGLPAEYNGCPMYLVLDHFFDDAEDPATHQNIFTDVTFVPCSEDFNFQTSITNTVQFLVYNEFEQRFSTSRSVKCLTELTLSDIDTRPGPQDDYASIFNVNVEGTLTGQTWIRSVASSDPATTPGHGLLAVAEEFHGYGAPWSNSISLNTHSAAFVPLQGGLYRMQSDIVLLPGAVTCSGDSDCPQPPEGSPPLHCRSGACLP